MKFVATIEVDESEANDLANWKINAELVQNLKNDMENYFWWKNIKHEDTDPLVGFGAFITAKEDSMRDALNRIKEAWKTWKTK